MIIYKYKKKYKITLEDKKMKVTVALKHKNTYSTIISKIATSGIKFWTNSKYFHAEIIVSDFWLSATATRGIQMLKLDDLNDNWDYFDIDVEQDCAHDLLNWFHFQLNSKYDWKGIFLTQFVNINKQDQNKWFCSELVAECLKKLGIKENWKESHQYSPEDIHQLCKRIGTKRNLSQEHIPEN
jgi:hypothetical protein